MAFRPDGHRLVSHSFDGTVRLWSADVGRPLQTGQGDVRSVAFSPDGHRLASAGLDGTVRLWDARPAANPLDLPRGPHRTRRAARPAYAVERHHQLDGLALSRARNHRLEDGAIQKPSLSGRLGRLPGIQRLVVFEEAGRQVADALEPFGDRTVVAVPSGRLGRLQESRG